MQKEVNLSSLHPVEEKEMIKLSHINIQVKNKTLGVLFDIASYDNLIAEDQVSHLGL